MVAGGTGRCLLHPVMVFRDGKSPGTGIGGGPLAQGRP